MNDELWQREVEPKLTAMRRAALAIAADIDMLCDMHDRASSTYGALSLVPQRLADIQRLLESIPSHATQGS